MSVLEEISGVLADDDEISVSDTWDALRKRITVLNERAWEGRVNWGHVERWLENFDGRSGHERSAEKLHALYLLAQFLYFGSVEIRVLLRALYRDLFLVPLIQQVRSQNGHTRDISILQNALDVALSNTRFLGVGNPSESGVHLLYYFRQENRLTKQHFLDSAQILEKEALPDGTVERVLRLPNVERYVFVDDVCGSGETALDYSKNFLADIKSRKPDVQLYYLAMFGSAEGMKKIREQSLFGPNAAAIFEMDGTYKCLSPESRYLKVAPPTISPDVVRAVIRHYGELVLPGHGGGYEDSQMLLGFHHNTPDNTVPVIWMEPENRSAVPWTPIFRRYPKFLGGLA